MAVAGIPTSLLDIGSKRAAQSAGARPKELGRDEFMLLLLTQLRNQNPLEPLDNAEFLAQLAQFSSLDSMEKLNGKFDSLIALQGLSQGSSLIGKRIEYQLPGETSPRFGVVDSVRVTDGKVELMVGGEAVSLQQVRSVTNR